MDIYIQPHLRRIPLVRQMCDMIEKYAEYYKDSSSSFDNYKYYLKLDPVKRFLGLCIPRQDEQTVEDYEITINYISRLFYSVKGTIKVFEYMRRYLPFLNIIGDIIYTVEYIEIEFGDLALDDEELFYQCLEDFLRELLFYGKLKLNSNITKLKISSEIINYLSGDSAAYLAFDTINTEYTTNIGN